jgi:polysaccharide pyruvyl transferase WcaK-like protein
MKRFSFGSSINNADRENKYIQLMADIIDYLKDTFDADVCLIPHMYGRLLSNKIENDRDVCEQIYSKVKNKQSVAIIHGEYMPDELKGIIGICDMFIGCRLHATIASTSLGIPTIAIAYGDKYYRIIGDTMGQEEYIVDITKSSYDEMSNEIKFKINSLWRNRDKVKETLTEKTKIVKEIAISYPKLVKELIEKSQRQV